MIVTTLGDEVVAIVRVYDGEKWVKVIHEDESVSWERTANIAEEEI